MSFQCPNCKKEFTSNTYLDNHVKNEICSFKCEKCHYEGRDRHTLYRHMKQKHPDSTTTPAPPINLMNSTLFQMSQHLEAVTGQKFEFVCEGDIQKSEYKIIFIKKT